MYQVKFTLSAEESLLNIVDYIALDNPIRAVTFVRELTESARQTLSLFPYSGRLTNNINENQDIRVWSYGRYNCYYHVIEEKSLVEILFVFHASRDIQKLMGNL